VLACLIGYLGDFDLAEESVAEAFAIAAQRWPSGELPDNPGAWLVTTARHRAIDRLRRDRVLAAKLPLLAQQPEEAEDVMDGPPIPDERLELVFMCCHPALAIEAQVALTLRAVAGLTTEEIARAFLVPAETMKRRLTRAKSKIKVAGIPFGVPVASQLPERLAAVLAVVYLIFNEGYKASAGERLVRDDLVREAIRLGRILAELMPDEPEVLGLLALMLLVEARRTARTTADGALVLLADQDRALWDRERIAEGQAIVRRCLRRNQPGPYQVQAAINAVHSDAASAADTDWRQILALYDQLLALQPIPVVALNRAVAVAEVSGPDAALAEVDDLDLDDFHLFHAVRADLLRRLGRDGEAADAYAAAIALAENAAERDFLQRRRATLR
jgi:RNA polymerase sigma-70 factor, ECF subfamily